MTPRFVVSATQSPDTMDGYDATGELVVRVQVEPKFKYLLGSEGLICRVTEWRVDPRHGERCAAYAAWRDNDYPVMGNA